MSELGDARRRIKELEEKLYYRTEDALNRNDDLNLLEQELAEEKKLALLRKDTIVDMTGTLESIAKELVEAKIMCTSDCMHKCANYQGVLADAEQELKEAREIIKNLTRIDIEAQKVRKRLRKERDQLQEDNAKLLAKISELQGPYDVPCIGPGSTPGANR